MLWRLKASISSLDILAFTVISQLTVRLKAFVAQARSKVSIWVNIAVFPLSSASALAGALSRLATRDIVIRTSARVLSRTVVLTRPILVTRALGAGV